MAQIILVMKTICNKKYNSENAKANNILLRFTKLIGSLSLDLKWNIHVREFAQILMVYQSNSIRNHLDSELLL